ncbi:hypothetical protein T08_2337 [Trichinella sp. T8]|nr:hypothetical protein T08_2337 [Trichinella sp. T8]
MKKENTCGYQHLQYHSNTVANLGIVARQLQILDNKSLDCLVQDLRKHENASERHLNQKNRIENSGSKTTIQSSFHLLVLKILK